MTHTFVNTVEALEFCLQKSHLHGWRCRDALGVSGASAAAVVQEVPAPGPARCLLGTVELEELSGPQWGNGPNTGSGSHRLGHPQPTR